MKKTMVLMACCGALQIGCGEKHGTLPEPDPNVLGCTGVEAGEPFAAPITVQTNCWSEDNVNLVMRGKAPKNGGTTTFTVHGKAGQGSLTRYDGPHAKAGCHMKLALHDYGLECRGDVTSDWQAVCYKGDDPKPVCSMSWKPTSPYQQYSPTGHFPKYIEDYPQD